MVVVNKGKIIIKPGDFRGCLDKLCQISIGWMGFTGPKKSFGSFENG